jgi:hypothetical protein
MEKFNAIFQITTTLGLPTIFAILLWLSKKIISYSKQMKTLMYAQQAQMRGQLLKDYYKYVERGYIYEAELQDWENQYQAYHSLGANGIMDERRKRLNNLETREEIP